ncbi:hypothetical protein Acr_21g0008500 [Actinidia rufa]|uniref:Uncharacterized protein n=1 Tax=Actinidia rufa TaxID=165716 RepID=A0A7J0GHP4_9ERIC|nr:hypothetical protein Acr_21g0008500 [Actinidia rufa]
MTGGGGGESWAPLGEKGWQLSLRKGEDQRANFGCLIKGEAPYIVVGPEEGPACIVHVASSPLFGFSEVSLLSRVSHLDESYHRMAVDCCDCHNQP